MTGRTSLAAINPPEPLHDASSTFRGTLVFR